MIYSKVCYHFIFTMLASETQLYNQIARVSAESFPLLVVRCNKERLRKQGQRYLCRLYHTYISISTGFCVYLKHHFLGLTLYAKSESVFALCLEMSDSTWVSKKLKSLKRKRLDNRRIK